MEGIIMELLLGLVQIIGVILLGLLIMFVCLFLKYFFENLQKLRSGKQLAEKEATEKLILNTMIVKVQEVQGQLMMYDIVTGLFVAQAETLDDLWKAVDLRFPSKNVILADDPTVQELEEIKKAS